MFGNTAMSSTVTTKGQVTIPKKIREILGLRPGDKLDFLVEPDGTVRITPLTASIRELKALVPRPEKTLTLEEMEAAIATAAGNR